MILYDIYFHLFRTRCRNAAAVPAAAVGRGPTPTSPHPRPPSPPSLPPQPPPGTTGPTRPGSPAPSRRASSSARIRSPPPTSRTTITTVRRSPPRRSNDPSQGLLPVHRRRTRSRSPCPPTPGRRSGRSLAGARWRHLSCPISTWAATIKVRRETVNWKFVCSACCRQ